MKRINTLDHWQVFLILFACPITASVLGDVGPSVSKTVSNFFSFCLYVCWVWCIGFELSPHQPSKILLTLVNVLLLVFLVFATIILESNYESMRLLFTALTFMMLMLSSFITGRILNLAGGGKNFWNSILNGLAILLFPVGIWFIQPQVNKLVRADSSN